MAWSAVKELGFEGTGLDDTSSSHIYEPQETSE